WTESDRKLFEERTNALIAQYDALVPAGLDEGQHVNGALTVGENIGDLGGRSIGWKALELELGERAGTPGQPVAPSTEQAKSFFCAWATAWLSKARIGERVRRLPIDPHSREEFRCSQVLKNMTASPDTFAVAASDGRGRAPAER